MKITKLVPVLALAALGFTSCKDEKETIAEKTVETYVVYVDSLGTAGKEGTKANWASIDEAYQMRISEAEAALVNFKDNKSAQERINASKAKYEALKAEVEADMKTEMEAAQKTAVASNPKQMVRDRLFGAGKIGDDMSFAWVNKDNILKVYDTFFQAYKDNKESFSREDYDEVKLMYEALDSRKNTVEKEGLSSSDNGKIASIKFKFAPMFKMNRIGAKSRENQAAKE